MKFNKIPLSIDDQIKLLQDRGLIFSDLKSAKSTLSNISYYRLAGYWWSFQIDKVNHKFYDGTSFEDIIELYNFDAQLRQIIFKVIEKNEIGLRTKLIHYLSQEFSPWWFENPSLFKNQVAFENLLNTIKSEVYRSKDEFIKTHFLKYKNDKRLPPSWKALEITSLGTISKLYGNLKNQIEAKDKIAKDFGAVNHQYLPSWLQSMTYIRNLCAHHNRLFNKRLVIKPKLLKSPPQLFISRIPSDHSQIYLHLCLLIYMYSKVSPENNVKKELIDLFKRYPHIKLSDLGFPPKWNSEPFWLP